MNNTTNTPNVTAAQVASNILGGIKYRIENTVGIGTAIIFAVLGSAGIGIWFAISTAMTAASVLGN